MNPELGAFDPRCRDCQHGEPHTHCEQRFEQRWGQCGLELELVMDFTPVNPPIEIELACWAWRDYKAGCTRRPRKGDTSLALPVFF